MADGEITVSYLGSFGAVPFWGAGDYPIWGQGAWEPTDAIKQPHYVSLFQPPPNTKKLRFRWGNDSGDFDMVEFPYPSPPPGFEQYFVGEDPPGPGKVELQIEVNIGPTVSGGPDQQYFQLEATAGDWLGIWYADTNEWHEWPDPPVPTRTWSYEMLRSDTARWWCVTAVYPLGGSAGGCPPVPRPPFPYFSPPPGLSMRSKGRRLKLERRAVGMQMAMTAFNSPQHMQLQAMLNELRKQKP